MSPSPSPSLLSSAAIAAVVISMTGVAPATPVAPVSSFVQPMAAVSDGDGLHGTEGTVLVRDVVVIETNTPNNPARVVWAASDTGEIIQAVYDTNKDLVFLDFTGMGDLAIGNYTLYVGAALPTDTTNQDTWNTLGNTTFEITQVNIAPVIPTTLTSPLVSGTVSSHPLTSSTFPITGITLASDPEYASFTEATVYSIDAKGDRVDYPATMEDLLVGASIDYRVPAGITAPEQVDFFIDVVDHMGISTTINLGSISINRDLGTIFDTNLTSGYLSGGVEEGGVYYATSDLTIGGQVDNIFQDVTSVVLKQDGTEIDSQTPDSRGKFEFIVPFPGDGVSHNYTVETVTESGDVRSFALEEFQAGVTGGVTSVNTGPQIAITGVDTSNAVGTTNWASSPPTVTVTIHPQPGKPLSFRDRNTIIMVGGSKISTDDSRITRTDLPDGGVEYVLAPSFFPDGQVANVSVTASGIIKIGETTQSIIVGVDTLGVTDANTSVTLIDPVVTTPWGHVSKTAPSVRVESNPVNGVESITYNGDTIVGVNSNNYIINSGNPSFTIVDNLGNSYTEDLGKAVFVDAELPTISISGPVASGAWVADPASKITVVFKDNLSLGTTLLTVNGVEVDAQDYVQSTNAVGEHTFVIDVSKLSIPVDGIYQVEATAVDVAGNSATSQSYTVKVDSTRPVIDYFEIVGPGLADEGADTQGSRRFGFYLQGASQVNVHVYDPNASSGIGMLTYELLNSEGNVTSTGTVSASSGVASIAIPDGFRGYIRATVSDNVGNVSESNRPDGIVTESSNVAVSNTSAVIHLPDTPYRDVNGVPLYNSSQVLTFTAHSLQSGIRSLSWTGGAATVAPDGGVPGALRVMARQTNLVTIAEGTISVLEDGNGQSLFVNGVTRTNHSFSTETTVSIDTIAPVIDVSYSSAYGTGYFNTDRSATITVTDANFDPALVTIQGIPGTLSGWTNVGGNTWQAVMSFTDNMEYSWTISATDRAGNTSSTYTSETFTVDKINPTVRIDWMTGATPVSSNALGDFFGQTRTALITVVDENFNPATGVTLIGDGVSSGWSSNGSTHTMTITWSEDGVHSGGIHVVDLAGNVSETIEVPEFILDTVLPDIVVDGVTAGAFYHQNIGLQVHLSDQYLDPDSVVATLLGRNGQEIELTVQVDNTTGNIVLEGFPEGAEFDDLYTLRVTASDYAGNLAEHMSQFVLNRNGSSFSFTSQDINGLYLQQPLDVVLQEVTPEEVDMETVEAVVTRNGQGVEIPEDRLEIAAAGGEDSHYTYTYSMAADNFEPEGTYRVQVNTTGVGGAVNTSARISYGFVIDRTEPDVVIGGINEGETYHEDSLLATVTVRDSSGITDVSATYDGGMVALTPTDSEGVYTIALPATADPTTLKVSATDRAENVADVEVADFHITTSWPAWMIASIVGGVGVLLAGIAGIFFAIAKRRKKDEEGTTSG